MKYMIRIPKKGKNIGQVIVEGLEHNEQCESELEKIAVGFGPIQSREKIDHFDDDQPVHDGVSII